MESALIPQQRNEGPTIAFLKTPSGVMMVVNFLLLFISWCVMAGWKAEVNDKLADKIESESGFYLFTTVLPWLIYILLFIVLVLGCQNNMPAINWPLTFIINCGLWAFLLFISSIIIATKVKKYDCKIWECDRLRIAAAFGFLSMFGLLLQAFFHHREFKSSSSNPV